MSLLSNIIDNYGIYRRINIKIMGELMRNAGLP